MKRRKDTSYINAIVLIAIVLIIAAALAATAEARTGGWNCLAGGSCHVFIEWSKEEPTTVYILSNPGGCGIEANGEAGFIVRCE